MFELPKAIQTQDIAGSLLMKQAEESRLQQQQLSILVQKNEQARQEAFGDAQKRLFDISSAQGVPAEAQRQILTQGMDELTKLYKDRSNVRSGDISMMAMNTLVKAKSDATAYQQYLENGDKAIQMLKSQGGDEFALKTALSSGMFDERVIQTPNGQQVVKVPKDPTQLGDPAMFLFKESDDKPTVFMDRTVTSKDLKGFVNDYKPGELKISDTRDLTGTKTIKYSYTEKKYPWTRTEDIQQNGITVKQNVLDTVPETINGTTAYILSDNAFNAFVQNPNPKIVKEVDAMGLDYINAHNRGLGINPGQVTRQNFQQVYSQFPEGLPADKKPIDPYDPGNRVMFSRLALTKMLDPTFGKFGDASVTIDKAKPSVTNVFNSDIYNRTGNIRSEAKFPTAWAQIINQDADVMRVAEETSFQYEGKPLTAKKVGDRAQGQIIKDNGTRATVLARPEEPGVIYIAEIEDNEITDKVVRLSGQEAIDYGAKVSAANGSDIKTFGKLYKSATTTVVPMSDADRANATANINLQGEKDAGKDLISGISLIRAMEEGQTKDFNNARIKLNGADVVIKSITRKDTGWFTDSPMIVELKGGKTMTFNSRDELVQSITESNK